MCAEWRLAVLLCSCFQMHKLVILRPNPESSPKMCVCAFLIVIWSIAIIPCIYNVHCEGENVFPFLFCMHIHVDFFIPKIPPKRIQQMGCSVWTIFPLKLFSRISKSRFKSQWSLLYSIKIQKDQLLLLTILNPGLIIFVESVNVMITLCDNPPEQLCFVLDRKHRDPLSQHFHTGLEPWSW